MTCGIAQRHTRGERFDATLRNSAQSLLNDRAFHRALTARAERTHRTPACLALEFCRTGDAAELADDPASCHEPEHLSVVGGEPSLVGLFAAEEVHLGEAPGAGVVDDVSEQGGRRVPPAGIGQPGALVQADAPGHLERQHDGNHEVAAAEFVDHHLVDRRATGASGEKYLEGGKELGEASPLCLVELAEYIEAWEDRHAPDRPMGHPLGREAVGRFTEIATELFGQGGPERLCVVWQRRERGRGHRFEANAARQGVD